MLIYKRYQFQLKQVSAQAGVRSHSCVIQSPRIMFWLSSKFYIWERLNKCGIDLKAYLSKWNDVVSLCRIYNWNELLKFGNSHEVIGIYTWSLRMDTIWWYILNVFVSYAFLFRFSWLNGCQSRWMSLCVPLFY